MCFLRRRRILAVDRRQVIDARLGAQLFHEPESGALGRDLGELDGLAFAVGDGVLEFVAEVDGAHVAVFGAAGKHAHAQHLRAKNALLDDSLAVRIVVLHRVRLGEFLRRVRRLGPVERTRRIRALGDAVAAADAAFLVHHDDAVGALVSGAHRAAAHARRVVAVHAGARQEIRSRGRIIGDFVDLDPFLQRRHEMHLGAGFGAVRQPSHLARSMTITHSLFPRRDRSRRQRLVEQAPATVLTATQETTQRAPSPAPETE